MNISNSYQTWIEAGYTQFAEAGLEGIHIELLARTTKLNKSGFYHYFGDKETLLEQLMKHHCSMATALSHEMNEMKQIDPDLLLLMTKYKIPVIAHRQLVRNRHNRLLDEYYHKVNKMLDPIVLPHWARYIGMTDNLPLALRYFEQTRKRNFNPHLSGIQQRPNCR